MVIIALAAIILFGMAGCEQATGNGQTAVDPAAADFNVGVLIVDYDGSSKAVSITAKEGKSQGAITVFYEGTNGTTYAKSTNAPLEVGHYTVTFDVAAAAGYKAASGLNAGTLIIRGNTPEAEDYYTIGELTVDQDGTHKAVSITLKDSDRSQGQITVWYTGIGGTDYPKSTEAPSAAGRYAVTFDVAAAAGFNAANDLVAGTLVIRRVITDPHFIVDFEDAAWAGGGNAGSYGQRTITWNGYEWTVRGVTHPSSEDLNDRRDGTASIRLRSNSNEVANGIPNGIELVSYLSGKITSISFDYASYSSHNGGEIILYTQEMDGEWTAEGSVIADAWEGAMQTIEFDLGAGGKENVRFKIEKVITPDSNFTSVNIDNIVIIGESDSAFDVAAVDPVADDFNIDGLSPIHDGSPKEVSITPYAGKSQGAITIWYEGDDVVYAKSNTAPSDAGSYIVTFDVAAAEGFNAVNGLSAGTLVITLIIDPHFLVDFEGDEWDGTAYAARAVESGGYDWTVSGVGRMDGNDRREGDRSIRFRGGSAADTGENTNRVELMDYLPGIKSISFDYASYSSHSNGVITLFYELESNKGTWVPVGEPVTVPSWTAGGSALLNKHFDLDINASVRFKVEKLFVGTGSISANVDNILVTTY